MWFIKKKNTITIECPHCGAPHDVEFVEYDNVYLDGVPKLAIKDLMRRFAICTKCGLLYTTGNRVPARVGVETEEYRKVFNTQYADITEKKLQLLELMYQPAYIPLFLAHYYMETRQTNKYTQALQQATEYLTSHKDTYVYEWKTCGSLTFKSTFLCYPEYRLVDMYRQMQEWDKALAQIQKLQKNATEALKQYLELEEQLVQKQNSAIQ